MVTTLAPSFKLPSKVPVLVIIRAPDVYWTMFSDGGGFEPSSGFFTFIRCKLFVPKFS